MKFILFIVVLKAFWKVTTSGCNTVCQKECLDLHNLYRKNHRAMPLKLDKQLMKQADKWANNNVTRSTSGWVAKGGGECWAWGTMYTSWKKVIKDWHDQESNIDWTTKHSRNGKSVYCFSQIVWKRAKKLGCGRGILNSAPFYVAQIEVAAVVVDKLIGYEAGNILEPKVNDLNWFDDVTVFDSIGNASSTRPF